MINRKNGYTWLPIYGRMQNKKVSRSFKSLSVQHKSKIQRRTFRCLFIQLSVNRTEQFHSCRNNKQSPYLQDTSGAITR